jgi:uncharacterized protein (TIGR03083 family)
METDDYISALVREGQLLVDVSRSGCVGEGADARVPTCPDWVWRDLLAHVGFVHRWAAGYVAKGLTEMVEEPGEEEVLSRAPGDDQLVEWVAEGHKRLVGSLRSAPADLNCWTFLAAPSPLAFWSRRQAHETAVHRVDAELAAGQPPGAIGTSFAVDGIDELLLGFLARRRSRRLPELEPGVIRFEASDTGDSWTVQISPDRMETTKGPSTNESELSVTGPASELYLLLWNRRRSASVEVDGRQDLLDQWPQRVRVTW